MSKVTVDLPESLHRRAAALAAADGSTLDHFIALAVAEKLSAMGTVEYLRQEAAAGRNDDFDRSLDAVPSAAPAETDRLP